MLKRITYLLALGLELVHQILTIILSFTHGFAPAKQELEQRMDASETVVELSVVLGIVLAGVLGLIILGILLWAVLNRQRPTCQKIVLYFTIYFAFRAFLLFSLTPEAAVLYAVDGCVQILVACVAVTAWLLKE